MHRTPVIHINFEGWECGWCRGCEEEVRVHKKYCKKSCTHNWRPSSSLKNSTHYHLLCIALFSNIFCAAKFGSKTAKLNINSIRNNSNNNSNHHIPFVNHQIWHNVCEKKVRNSSPSKSFRFNHDGMISINLCILFVAKIKLPQTQSRAWFLNYSFTSTQTTPNSTKLFVRLENILRSFPCEHNNNGARISAISVYGASSRDIVKWYVKTDKSFDTFLTKKNQYCVGAVSKRMEIIMRCDEINTEWRLCRTTTTTGSIHSG